MRALWENFFHQVNHSLFSLMLQRKCLLHALVMHWQGPFTTEKPGKERINPFSYPTIPKIEIKEHPFNNQSERQIWTKIGSCGTREQKVAWIRQGKRH